MEYLIGSIIIVFIFGIGHWMGYRFAVKELVRDHFKADE